MAHFLPISNRLGLKPRTTEVPINISNQTLSTSPFHHCQYLLQRHPDQHIPTPPILNFLPLTPASLLYITQPFWRCCFFLSFFATWLPLFAPDSPFYSPLLFFHGPNQAACHVHLGLFQMPLPVLSFICKIKISTP